MLICVIVYFYGFVGIMWGFIVVFLFCVGVYCIGLVLFSFLVRLGVVLGWWLGIVG